MSDPPRQRGGRHRRVTQPGWLLVQVVGELAVTAGVVLALFVGYEVVLTNLWAAQDQQGAASELDRIWADERANPSAGEAPAAPGSPVARLEIPRLGDGWSRVVVEGTEAADLSRGPGHYPGTARPGGTGNLAIAGHRVGRGAPFDGLGDMAPCDEIALETATRRYTYRVLPIDGAPLPSTPDCGQLGRVLGARDAAGAVYRGINGREIVAPGRVDVIAPVPDRPGVTPPASVRVLTLTTCHPRFSARQRMIIHAVLVDDRPRDPR